MPSLPPREPDEPAADSPRGVAAAPRRAPEPERLLRVLLADPLNPLRTFRVMGRLVRRVVARPGAPPGTLVHTGERKVETVSIHILDFGPDGCTEREVDSVEECFPFRDRRSVTWINVTGLHDPSVVEQLGTHFGLHPLVLEDILTVGQRPKVEDHEEYLFLELHMLRIDPSTRLVQEEQLSLAVGDGWVLTFQERPGDVLEPVRERLRSGKGRIRSRGADYLAYALVDAVVDSYFGVLESIGNQVEELEEAAMDHPDSATMHQIHDLRREMIMVRKSVWPVRDLLASLLRIEIRTIQPDTRPYLRDVYDHTIQLIDTVENLRDLVSGLMELYLSTVSNRTNEVMKVLTIIATIFIPLTFLAGVYGMNFRHMPELEVWWAYPALWVVMIGVAVAMLAFFRRRGWL